MWETQNNKKWYDLTITQRREANQEMDQMKEKLQINEGNNRAILSHYTSNRPSIEPKRDKRTDHYGKRAPENLKNLPNRAKKSKIRPFKPHKKANRVNNMGTSTNRSTLSSKSNRSIRSVNSNVSSRLYNRSYIE